MVLTGDFNETVLERMQMDADFRHAMLAGTIEAVMDGELELSKIKLRRCVDAILGFDALGKAIGKPPKSIMHMLSAKGKPTTEDFFKILACLHKQEGLRFDPAEAYYKRAMHRYRQGDMGGAVADYNESIRFNPDNKKAIHKRDAALEQKAIREETSIIRLAR